MIVATITQTGARETAGKLARLQREFGPSLVPAMRRATALMERDLKKAMTGSKGRHPFFGVTGAPAPTIGARSGHTRRSVVSDVVVKGTHPAFIIGSVGSPLRHLLALEEGATISGNRYLRIPLATMQTAAGVDRNAGRSVRGLPGTFILRSKQGNLFIARSQGKDLELLYLLKETVRIRPRHVFRETARRTTGPIGDILNGHARVQVMKAN